MNIMIWNRKIRTGIGITSCWNLLYGLLESLTTRVYLYAWKKKRFRQNWLLEYGIGLRKETQTWFIP